jgi:hypothetical protein
VGAPQRFIGTLLFPSSERAAAAVLALPGHAAKVALDDTTLKRRGAQVDVDFENVIGAAFFAPTVMALRALAAPAIAGSIWAVYNWGADRSERESHTIDAGQPTPGLPKKPTAGVARAVRCGLLAPSPGEIAYAAESVTAGDVPGVAAIFDALTEPIQKARIGRTLVHRTEAEAKRVLRAIAAMTVDPADPWADELRAIQAALSPPPRTARAAASPPPASARGAARRPSPRRAPAKPRRAPRK